MSETQSDIDNVLTDRSAVHWKRIEPQRGPVICIMSSAIHNDNPDCAESTPGRIDMYLDIARLHKGD